MQPALAVALILALVVLLWLFVRWRSPRPEFPPLMTSPDDPLMKKALANARETIPEFLTLLRAPRESALIKLHFVSNSDEVEHLWAEVVEVLGNDELGVRLVTPPVTHTGPLDRLHRCKLDDIEDWQVVDAEGKIHGAFTQRAMFAIARRDGVELPKKLLEQEHHYMEE